MRSKGRPIDIRVAIQGLIRASFVRAKFYLLHDSARTVFELDRVAGVVEREASCRRYKHKSVFGGVAETSRRPPAAEYHRSFECRERRAGRAYVPDCIGV